MNNYHFYGLTVSTPFPCPELLPSLAASDVIVSYEQIDDSGFAWCEQGVCYKVMPGKCLLKVKGIARYLLLEGKQIVIEKYPAAHEDAVRLFFYNEVAAALLMQREMLVLKASVVVRDGKAMVLLGSTSVGKSMAAAALCGQGYAVLADGVCAIRADGEVFVSPGFPALLLWKMGLQKLELSPENYKPVRTGMNKFYFPVSRHFMNETLPVAKICFLTEHNQPEMTASAIAGADKFFAILSHGYHPGMVRAMGMMGKVNELATMTAQQANMQRIGFSMSANSFDEYIEFLEGELAR